MPRCRSRFLLVGLVAAIVAAAGIGVAPAQENRPARASSGSIRTPRGVIGAGQHVLIYGPTLADARPINEAKVARRLGFHVKVVTKVEWSAMTQEEFGDFDVIVFGDPSCKNEHEVRFDAAIANQDVWSPAVDGNVAVSGFDAVWHANHGTAPGPERLIANMLRFTSLGDGTGLDVSLSCYYNGADPGTPVPLLDGIGAFTVNGQGVAPVPNCPNHIAVTDLDHPLVDRLTAQQLSHWDCSVHQAIDGVAAGFDTVATLFKSGLPVLVGRTAA